MRVLVVDDDPDLALLVELMLTRAGHEVRSAADGVQGLAVLEECHRSGAPIEAVVLDRMMPRLDGPGLARAIRDDAALAATPLLMMSAHHELADAALALVDAFLAKPFTRVDLASALEAVTSFARTPHSTGRRGA